MAKIGRRPHRDDESTLPSPLPLALAPDASPGDRWRLRRDLVIYLAYRQGLSQQFIADAFDLSKSLVRVIINRLSLYENDEIGRRPHLDVESPPPPRDASPGRRARFRRDRVIRLAHRQGLSQRFIADVFDLPRSRIAEIIKQVLVYESSEA